ncbi:HsdM family class I SAM-dependent methyltransferase [Riemerella columbina]|uniref:HsdM family class I SAM-dependent methyltransferase n=1 Tax=Riemerella columbina TaxID=103810 RepID=UPI00266F0925|nr:N-6 DNA methylase [Riemerella columbina]WKS95925.1 N-6 DNA methylase [Riemerella columbina]
MIKNSCNFHQLIANLGFAMSDDCLFLVEDINCNKSQVKFHLEKANELEASAVYFRKQLNGSYKPQVYLFDFTDRNFDQSMEDDLAKIQTNIWSSGEVPLACFFYNTEIKIIDCTKHITEDYKPKYLIEKLKLTGRVHKLYNEQFAIKIKSGIFWEEEELKNKFKFQNSAYDKLIDNIRYVSKKLTTEFTTISTEIVNKIIVQSILIKYLEETIDDNGNKLLSKKYFQKYNKASSFNDVLRQEGKFVELLSDLNHNFNGNVFKWEKEEQNQLKKVDLSLIADLLNTDKTDLDSKQLELGFPNWRYFEFKQIPVELISRLYEEFLAENKQDKGLYYTPLHLAKLLIDECIPLKKYKDFNLKEYTILDPACGSGIFLVVAFKRLVQIWRLQNNMKTPNINVLKSILRNIYGVDKEEQAVRLASFSLSLALCNELNPLTILNELKFDDLTKTNLIHSDFFECRVIEDKKFNLVIGNPPYVRGGTKDFKKNTTKFIQKEIEIPNNQIALKFLGDSYSFLKKGGLQCLLVKSSGILYNTGSRFYLETLLTETNVVQILDFTALARNRSLWDNKKVSFSVDGKKKETPLEVETAAVFIKEGKPNFSRNILHLTFRRTKATKERIIFEIDDYDLHFVNRQTAISNKFIWKNNLLGGGRIKQIIEKLSNTKKIEEFFKNYGIYGEGAGGAKSLHNDAFLGDKIESSFITQQYISSFEGLKEKEVYKYPNFLIKENIELPFSYNDKQIKFSNEIVGFYSSEEQRLRQLTSYFENNIDVLKFYNICTSGKLLVYKNTACKQEDILNLPFDFNINLLLSEMDNKIISEVNNIMQMFLRNGENSKALQPIKQHNLLSIISNYGAEFSRALNAIYQNKNRKFRLSDVVQLKNSLIATVFKYDNENIDPKFGNDLSELDIQGLTTNDISAHLSVNRIIKLYPQKDTIVFVKPNQYRYWLSLTAYRDADKCFSDFSNAGF